MSEVCYYLDDFTDEVVPCDCTLQGWADWLSKPDVQWHRDAAAEDRATFRASVMTFAEDIIATHDGDGWTFDREEPEAVFFAIRFGQGLGWDADCIADDLEGIKEILDLACSGCDAIEHIAVGRNAPDVMIRYRADPPRCIVEPIQ